MDQMHEGSTSSIASTPEPDAEAAQDHSQPQKRKGGRKPIYATSEERKQRNRQAQAAFRERRTEYIKQLEATIKLHEDNLQNLQQSHRSAADECLMLRYKNSLLERILVERGIDVQAELHARTGSPALGPTHMPPAAPAPQTSGRCSLLKQVATWAPDSFLAFLVTHCRVDEIAGHGPSRWDDFTNVRSHGSAAAAAATVAAAA
ncbi:hypothetical protein B0A49_03927 [Cryomyces minteri]|uniref:BZIP domain-containing protein n=1 Tax=Cryomyces minteri TaxID=331657 RepID=A0A4U0X4S4_9PEZI|nr:hypothetical protein B0A49_03927 [Cryomyces minteri]